MGAGTFLIIGFQGATLPRWVEEFARDHRLGGIILFDYDCQSKTFDNNIHSQQQVRDLCAAIHALPSKPLVFIDQEGGKVRRLKENLGFKPLPSALVFNTLTKEERIAIATESFHEMRQLGIDYNLAPVVDLNYNPKSPGLGGVERSYSVDTDEVRTNVALCNDAAKLAGLGLCLKHYPGLGGANVDSHHDFTMLGEAIPEEQIRLFTDLAPRTVGDAILVSHGVVSGWDDLPVSISKSALGALRARCPNTLFVSDDMQMQGLLKARPLKESCFMALEAGMDMLIIGNNLFRIADQEYFTLARTIEEKARTSSHFAFELGRKEARIESRKSLFSAS